MYRILSVLCVVLFSSNLFGAVVSNSNDSGPGSLRQLIADASPGETITFDESVFPNAIPFNTPIIINEELTISGFSFENRLVRFESISTGTAFIINTPDITVTIENVTLTSFQSNNADSVIIADAANLNLNISNVLIQASGISCSGLVLECKGGIIYFKGDTLNLDQSYLVHSSSICTNDNCIAQASGIFAEANELNITATYFEDFLTACIGNNCQANGGAIYVVDTAVNINNSYFDSTKVRCSGENCSSKAGVIFANSTTQNINLTHNLFKNPRAYCDGFECEPVGNIFSESIGSSSIWQLTGTILQQNQSDSTIDCFTNSNNQIISLGHNIQAGFDCLPSPLTNDLIGPTISDYIIKNSDFVNGVSGFIFSSVSASPAVDAIDGMCTVSSDINSNIRPDNHCDIGPIEGSFFNWTNSSTGDLLDSNNWSNNLMPDNNSQIFIQNGGTGIIDTLNNPDEVGAIQFKDITIGDHTGGGQIIIDGGTDKFGTHLDDREGKIFVGSTQSNSFLNTGIFEQTQSHLTVRNIPEFIVGNKLYVGSIYNLGDAQVDIKANLTLENINSIIIGDDLEIAEPELEDIESGGIVKVESNIDIKEIQSFVINDELDIIDGSFDENQENAIDYTANINIQDVDLLTLTSLDIIEVSLDNRSDVLIESNAVFKNIENMSIWTGVDNDETGHLSTGYNEQIRYYESFDKTPVINSTTLFDNVNLTAQFISLFSETDIDNEAQFDINLHIQFLNSNILLQGKDEDNVYSLGILNNNIENMTSTSSGSVIQQLSLDASHLTASSAIIGPLMIKTPNLLGGAILDLDNASFIEFTEDLTAHPLADFTFNIDGINRVNSANVGNTGYYSAINVATATLANKINVDFDEALSSGTHHFDLIISSAIDGIIDTNLLPQNLNIIDLDPGMSIDGFGVITDEGVEKLRLTVSGDPIASDLSISATVDKSMPALGETVTFNITAANNGPANQSNVAVSSLLDVDLQSISWSCIAQNGSTCQSSTGIGDLNNAIINLNSGTSVTFMISAQVANISSSHFNDFTISGSAIDYHQENNQIDLTINSDLIMKNGFE